MIKVAILTNVPSPYRVDFFNFLQMNYKEYKFYILYSSKNEDNRNWIINKTQLLNSYFLKSKTLKIKKKMDYKYIHIPIGVAKTLDVLIPDIVVGMEYNPTSLLAIKWCLKKDKHYISWTDGTLNSEKNINLIQKWSRAFIIKNASAYLASSTHSKMAQIFYGAAEEKIFVSFLSINIDDYYQEYKDNAENQIIVVGSLIKRKGIDLLLETLSSVTDVYKLVIVGDGPEKELLKKQSERLAIKEKIYFTGYLDKIHLLEEYSKSSIFVLPTREDCYALVILEAMCSGLPIISSKYADGAYDLIEEGKNGYIDRKSVV